MTDQHPLHKSKSDQRSVAEERRGYLDWGRLRLQPAWLLRIASQSSIP